MYVIVIQQVIVKVFHQDAENKHKFNKIRTYCYNRLTDFRCEERRRVCMDSYEKLIYISLYYAFFCSCLAFPALATEEFAD